MLAACLLTAACGGGSGGTSASLLPPANGNVASPTITVAPIAPATVSYVNQQNGFEYRMGKTSPLEQAFADAGIAAAKVDRSAQAFVMDAPLLPTLPHGHLIMTLLAANGLREGENYSYLDVGTIRGGPNFTLVRERYLTTSANSITNMSFEPVFTSNPRYRGILPGSINDHSWVVAGTGNSYKPGPLHIPSDAITLAFNLAELEGTDAAAATGKFRYVYGLNAEQTGRHPRSNGCLRYEMYCIGAPFEFTIEYGGTVTVIAGTSYATPYVFAAMLAAWERLDTSATPAAVFAMADACTVDLGQKGPDADTGLGRLDIGCMAAATHRAGVSPLAPATVSYVNQQNGFEYRMGKTSPLEQAFADAGIAAAKVDRSSQAFVFDLTLTKPHGNQIMTILAANGLREGENYRYRQISSTMYFGNRPDFALVREQYRTTSADSITSMSFGPVFTSDAGHLGIDTSISDHSWVVAATGNRGQPGPLYAPSTVTISALAAQIEGTDTAAATGKLRYVYGLNAEQTGRHPRSNGCLRYEMYCIGASFEFTIEYGGTVTVIAGTSYATPYVFAAMLSAWERLDASATPATVFAMADACTVDLGPEGPDADTGLGRLDIGCMAAATHKAGSSSSSQETVDGFVQDLFASRLGHLYLPGATDARMPVNLVGDSLRGHYRPAPAVAGYRPDVPEIETWRPPGSAFGLAHGPPDEAGLNWRGKGLDAALTYRKSRDFFGGSGSGQFEFASVRNLRLLIAGQFADGRLRWQAWSKFAKLAENPAAVDSLHGREIGAAITGRLASGATTLVFEAWLAQFRGGRISLAGGGGFPIAAGKPRYGLGVQIRHLF